MIVKFQGNKVKELHHYFDMMSFLQQIGAMTTPHAWEKPEWLDSGAGCACWVRAEATSHRL